MICQEISFLRYYLHKSNQLVFRFKEVRVYLFKYKQRIIYVESGCLLKTRQMSLSHEK